MTRRRPTPLGIDAERRPPCHVLFLSGELDLNATPTLERHAGHTWAQERRPALVVDLSGITFCDSSGAATLIRLLKRVNRAGGRLTLTGVPRQILRRLRVMGVLGLFTVCENADEAVTELRETA